jgi:hypothetical protein
MNYECPMVTCRIHCSLRLRIQGLVSESLGLNDLALDQAVASRVFLYYSARMQAENQYLGIKAVLQGREVQEYSISIR